MSELRLGDVVDDFCVKCRRLTNHSIVSLMDAKAAKVRCRTCYNDHDYRFEQAPPSKKDMKKAELFREVLAQIAPADGRVENGSGKPASTVEADGASPDPVLADGVVGEAQAAKKPRGRAKRA